MAHGMSSPSHHHRGYPLSTNSAGSRGLLGVCEVILGELRPTSDLWLSLFVDATWTSRGVKPLPTLTQSTWRGRLCGTHLDPCASRRQVRIQFVFGQGELFRENALHPVLFVDKLVHASHVGGRLQCQPQRPRRDVVAPVSCVARGLVILASLLELADQLIYSFAVRIFVGYIRAVRFPRELLVVQETGGHAPCFSSEGQKSVVLEFSFNTTPRAAHRSCELWVLIARPVE